MNELRIRVRELSKEELDKYGFKGRVIDPPGDPLFRSKDGSIEYYPDCGGIMHVATPRGETVAIAIGVCRVSQRPAVIDFSEFHELSEEAIVPMDGNVLIHLGETDDDGNLIGNPDVIEVRLGETFVMGWDKQHHAPHFVASAVGKPFINVMIILQNDTWKHDCDCRELPEPIPFGPAAATPAAALAPSAKRDECVADHDGHG